MKAKALPKETFYFYQSSDGQPIFLHALNVEMLIAEYGAFENCPKKIKGKILEVDSSSMTLDLRNKLRYLRHVPVTRTFEVAEITVEKPLVSKEVRERFSGQLKARHHLRLRRAKNEKRREKKIKVQEDKMMGKFQGAKNLRIESEFHFPKVGEDDSQNFLLVAPSLSSDRRISESSNVSADSSFGLYASPGAGLSYCATLRDGMAEPRPQTIPRSETFPYISSHVPRIKRNSDSEPEPEGYVPPPEMQTLGDALASALQRANGGLSKDKTSSKKKGKKMKGTKINLFG